MSPALPLALVLALLTPPQWRVIDGDTIELEGERIRLAGIDTPEIFSPECDAERMLGARAAAALAALLQTSGIEIRRHGEDRYGRTIADVLVNGRDAGEILVAEGYAVTWEGRRHDWCGTS
jgi:endonuclease YncB( thermonuclease family)